MSRITQKSVFFLIFSIMLWVGLSGCSPKLEEIPEIVEEIEEEAPVEEVVTPEEPEEPEFVEPEPVEIVLDMVHFDFDKYNLKSDALEILEANAKALGSDLEATITIEGHCDERGTVKYNLSLGEKRANSARLFLVNYGIEPSRIKIVSFGKERPLIPENNEAAWTMNRRAEFILD